MKISTKRMLFGALAALLSFAALAATTTPPSLLNPAGSTTGQAIISTGPSTAPVWGAAPLTGISGTLAIANGGTGGTSASAARTNLGLGTAATVNTGTSGATIPLLNGANTWAAAQTFSVRPTFNAATPWDSANLASPAATTGNLSQFASTTSAQLAAVLSDETGTGANVFGASPTITTPNIVGVTNGAAAAAGSLGETSAIAPTGVSLTSGTTVNLGSFSLSAGVWLVGGSVEFSPAATTVVSAQYASVSTTSATLGSLGQRGSIVGVTHAAGTADMVALPTSLVSVTSATTVYLVANATFSTSTCAASGKLWAVRIH